MFVIFAVIKLLVACNPDVGKKRVVISRGSSWTVGMPVISMIFGKESGAGDCKPRHFPKEGDMEFAIKEPIDQIDQLIWKWCEVNRPESAKPGSWYKENGIHERIKALVAVIQEDKA
jgi:hypothetical protein